MRIRFRCVGYGKRIVEQLARDLSARFGPGFLVPTYFKCASFTLPTELESRHRLDNSTFDCRRRPTCAAALILRSTSCELPRLLSPRWRLSRVAITPSPTELRSLRVCIDGCFRFTLISKLTCSSGKRAFPRGPTRLGHGNISSRICKLAEASEVGCDSERVPEHCDHRNHDAECCCS
jgi:hypothetical protein